MDFNGMNQGLEEYTGALQEEPKVRSLPNREDE